MSKIAVVYWTGTGNTEEMANAVAQGADAAGAEELESDEFEPVWEACKGVLGQKPVALFGSYGWGGGEWMDSWKEDAEAAGLKVVDVLIANEAPDEEAIEACGALGRQLAEA